MRGLFITKVVAVLCLGACNAPPAQVPSVADASAQIADAGADGAGEAGVGTPVLEATVYGFTDLPRTANTQALSATFFDETEGVLYAVSDRAARITPLRGSRDLKTWTPEAPLLLTGRPDPAWDGEGLTRVGDRLYVVSVETLPRVEVFDRKGAYVEPFSLPAVYAKQRTGNKGIESLAASPDGTTLYLANEQALTVDGPASTATRGTLVRILRHTRQTAAQAQFAYRTEPLGPGKGGDMGVSELAALGADRLLVLERGFQSDVGNTVRIFEVSLAGAIDVTSEASLGDDTKVVPKRLVVDLGLLPAGDATHPSKQANALLDNYESLSVGPLLPDGRRLLFVTSDDNESATQVARVLVLAVPGL